MPSAEIITIGTELLLGHLVDSNAAVIAAELADIGVDVYRRTSVGDNVERIAAALREAVDRADIVICAGGLGPTVDDVTREAAAAAAGRPLVLHEPSLEEIRGRFASLRRRMPAGNERQAMIPAGAAVLPNPHGTAPGFIVEDGRCVIIAMPGVPHEMAPMLREQVAPWLKQRFVLSATIVTRVLKTIGLPESEIDERIADLFRAGVNPTIAVLAHAGQVDVKITAKATARDAAAAMIAPLEAQLRECLGDAVYATDGVSMEQALGEALRARGWTIACAESCTGGLLEAMITSVPGSSDYFRGGIVPYADEVKVRLLNVPRELIERHGAVSEQVAAAMATGIKSALDAAVGVSITGIAGPTGGTPEKPIGLVYVGMAAPQSALEVKRLMLPGDRDIIRRRAALAALAMAWRAAR